MLKKKSTRKYTPSRGRFAGRTFSSRNEYQNTMARAKGYRNAYARRTVYVGVGSREKLEAMLSTARYKREDTLRVLGIMRQNDLGLTAGVFQFNLRNPSDRISSTTVKKYAGPALQKRGNKIVAKKYDRLLRIMNFPTPKGVIELEVRDSRSASRLGSYMNAIKKALQTGDTSHLQYFRGKYIRSNKLQYRFITDLETLEMLAEFDEFEFETLYEH